MSKKIFLPKNARTESRSQIKWLLWAALALMLFVVLAPLLTRQKDDRDLAERPASEKGMVVKEIPRAPDMNDHITSQDPSVPGVAPPDSAAEPVPGVRNPLPGHGDGPIASAPAGEPPDSGPGAVRSPVAPGLGPIGSAPSGALPGEGGHGQGMLPTAEPTPPSSADKPLPLAPESNPQVASVAPSATRPPKAPAVDKPPTAPHPQASAEEVRRKPTPPKATGRTLFSVQVGSFKERQNADDMVESLKSKGYAAVVKPSVHPSLGQLYVVQLQPVDNQGKANTLMEQIKHEEKVTPMIVRVPEGP